MPLTDNAYGLAKTQSALLAMLKEIDRVCRLRGIAYSLYAGTMLGAVREGGFIPWDDDLDLVFTADALHAFIKAFPSDSTAFQLALSDTWVVRVVSREPVQGMLPFVDLFHYEPASADAAKRARKLLLLRLLQGMLKENIRYSAYPFKSRVLVWSTHMLGLPFSKAQKLRWYRKTARDFARGDGTQLHIPDDCFAGIRHLYPAACAESFHDILFEGETVRVSDQAAQMLEIKYGKQYMTPPPVSERKPSHGR
ncbi:MAG: LicD family protein [Clostridia bacterium]